MSRLRLFRKALAYDLRRNLVETVSYLGRNSIRWGAARAFHRGASASDAVVILERQGIAPVPADSLRARPGSNPHQWQPWPIFWQKIPDARLVGKSLAVLSPAKTLMIESVYGARQAETDPSATYLHLPRAAKLAGNWTSLLSRWCPSQNCPEDRWLMDALPRLALLDQFPADTGILVGTSLTRHQRETLEILGVLDRCRPTRELHLEIENYYFSSPTAMTSCDNPYAIRFLRERFLPAAAPLPECSEKIYLVPKEEKRRPRNEKALIEILKTRGWTILHLEKYRFREHVSLFAGARAVCGPRDAGLIHLLWCQPGTQVLELCAANSLHGGYESLAADNGLDYRYLPGETEGSSRRRVDLDAFTAAIRGM